MDRKSLFQIGEVARLFQLSPGILRHYEKLGLLEPEMVDGDTGYRYYSTRQFEVLNTIRYLRVLNTPLEQIADFLKNRDIDRMQDLLLQQQEAVQEKKRELEIVERKIQNRLLQLQDAMNSKMDTVYPVVTAERRITWIRSPASLSSYLDLEQSIRELERGQREAMVFLGKIGVGITLSHLQNRAFGEYDMVFLQLDPEDDYHGKTEVWPPVSAVAIRFCGSHADAAGQYEKLAEYIDAHGLQMAGHSREITMIDYGMTNDTSRFVTEIQIPVCEQGQSGSVHDHN